MFGYQFIISISLVISLNISISLSISVLISLNIIISLDINISLRMNPNVNAFRNHFTGHAFQEVNSCQGERGKADGVGVGVDAGFNHF